MMQAIPETRARSIIPPMTLLRSAPRNRPATLEIIIIITEAMVFNMQRTLPFNQNARINTYFYWTCYFFFHFSRKAEQVMTSTEPALCTRAPTTGFSVPLIARTMAMKFNTMEKVMLHLMVAIIRFDRAIR